MRGLDRRRWTMAVLCGLALFMSLGLGLLRGDANGSNAALAAKGNLWADRRAESALQASFVQAEQAANLAQTALTAEQWDAVVEMWAGAIATLQTIPVQSPERLFAQRKQQEYVANLAIAQQKAEKLSWPEVFPSLGTGILDEQLRLYLSYLEAVGTPDILIVGSSRALQGLDPQLLQTTLL